MSYSSESEQTTRNDPFMSRGRQGGIKGRGFAAGVEILYRLKYVLLYDTREWTFENWAFCLGKEIRTDSVQKIIKLN